MLALELRRKRFGEDTVLRDLSLALSAGERLAILGPSGVGKTTLLRILAGLDTDFEGTRRAPARVGLMFQSPNLLLWRRVRDNLSIFHPEVPAEAIDQALAEVGLADKAGHFPDQLSLGQQRRLALARCFLGDNPLVLLDEPFASLDEALRVEMRALADRLARGRALVLVTHFAGDAEALGCRTLALRPPPPAT